MFVVISNFIFDLAKIKATPPEYYRYLFVLFPAYIIYFIVFIKIKYRIPSRHEGYKIFCEELKSSSPYKNNKKDGE
jgi:hypothetical protein